MCPRESFARPVWGLLNKASKITEAVIDGLHQKQPGGGKARKSYLPVARKKSLTKKAIPKGIKPQLQYLGRNFRTVAKQLDGSGVFSLDHKLQLKCWIIRALYDQRLEMYESRTQSSPDRCYRKASGELNNKKNSSEFNLNWF